MSSRKKGMDVPSIIVVFVIAVIILLFTLSLIRRTYPGFLSSATCNGRGGTCVLQSEGCGAGRHQNYLSGCLEGSMCCESDTTTTNTQPSTTQLSATEQDALKNGLIVTLNDVPTPLADRSTIPLKVGQQYAFKVAVNDKLKSAKGKIGDKCAVYVTDSNNRGEKYVLTSDGTLTPAAQIGDYTDNEIFDCSPGQTYSRVYKPTSLDAYKSLILYVILLDQSTSANYSAVVPVQGPPTLDENGNPVYPTGISPSNNPLFQSMYRNQQHWLVWRAYPLKVEPVIQISGMSTDWTAKSQITITCNGISCTNIQLALLKLKTGTYNDLLARCSKGETDSGDFKSAVNYISGTTVQSSGIPLNIDIGGFRLPYQQKLLYVTDSKPITVVNNKATVTIDKATMIQTFAGSGTYSDLLTEDKTYLCVKATQTSSQGGTAQTYYGLSDKPIKVDALPPYVDVDSGIQVVYPDPITSMNSTTPYYYRQYPTIRVSGCYDWGQSGCTNYDYYIKVGNFINLNSNTADWQTGLVGALLTTGVNSLITYFASKDAANTICPLMTSNGYIRNTNPEIRFMGIGQAIVCIRVGDKVGNTRLVWKPIWSPAEMLSRILVSQLT